MPTEILKNLNGIYLINQAKHNPKIPSDRYFIMGEFYNDRHLGHSINLYYGSIMALYANTPEDILKQKLREILQHELRHHMETLAGCDDLVRLDDLFVKQAVNSINQNNCN